MKKKGHKIERVKYEYSDDLEKVPMPKGNVSGKGERTVEILTLFSGLLLGVVVLYAIAKIVGAFFRLVL